jgi:hypothetical protein
MTPNFRWPKPKNAGHEKIVADVKEYGWHVLNVFGPEGPKFSYTIGLYLSFGHPELLVAGLPPEKAMPIVNLIGERVAKGEAFASGTVSTEILRNLPVSFRAVDPAHYPEWIGLGLWFYRSLRPGELPLLQIVWPDREGRFPWDEGFDESLRAFQPVVDDVA